MGNVLNARRVSTIGRNGEGAHGFLPEKKIVRPGTSMMGNAPRVLTHPGAAARVFFNAKWTKKFRRWNQPMLFALQYAAVRQHGGYSISALRGDERAPPRKRAMEPIGRKRWAIAEGYIPSQSSFAESALISHETACILNAGDQEAHVSITVFFANREPITYRVSVAARRTLHLRFNDLKEPEAVPCDTDYSSVFSPMCRSSCNTPASTLGMPKSACCRQRLTPKTRAALQRSSTPSSRENQAHTAHKNRADARMAWFSRCSLHRTATGDKWQSGGLSGYTMED